MTDKRKKIVAAFLLITAVGCFGIMDLSVILLQEQPE